MVGIFDLGSNSFISLVLDGKKELHEEVRVTSAASYLRDGKFESCENLKSEFDDMLKGVLKLTRNVHVFGTAVFREAENGKGCFEYIKGNFPGKILSADEEARYSYLSVVWDDEIDVSSPLVFDLGGGSLEVVGSDGFLSLPLGTKKIGKVSEENFRKVVEYVKKRLPDWNGDPVGIGGTFVTIAAFKLGEWDLRKVHGVSIDREDIEELFEMIKEKEPDEIDSLPFVPKERGKTLKEGCAIAMAIVEKFGKIVVSRRGYRYALAWEIDGRIDRG